MSERDHSLIAEFNARRCEDAFAALVRQHVNLVFATALRQVGDHGTAEEITQNVFVVLAESAGKLGSHPTIAGWLYQTTLNKSRERLRSDLRRRRREQVAMNLELAGAEGDSVWASLVPLLDEALLELREADRLAVVLHFMEGRTFCEVGSVLGIGEDAARKRANRCLDQLTAFFRRHGFGEPALTVGTSLFALSAHAAPAGLAASATTAGLAAAHTAASTSTLTLIKGALKIMAWTKMKTAIVVGVAILAAGTTTTLVIEKVVHPKLSTTDLSWADDPKYWAANSEFVDKLPPVFILRPTRLPYGGSMMFSSSTTHYYKRIGRKVDVKWLVTSAYGGYSQARCVFPADLSEEQYDMMFTLPEDYQKRMQAELVSRFGLTARVETRIVDVWLLKVKTSDAARLKRSDGNRHDWIGGQYKADIHGEPISDLIGWLEGSFGRPVLNQTGLAGNYDMDLKWKPQAGQSEKDAIRQMLLAQLGLELVPSREPVEMLVVEQAKK